MSGSAARVAGRSGLVALVMVAAAGVLWVTAARSAHPAAGEVAAPGAAASSVPSLQEQWEARRQARRAAVPVKLVDINSASRQELATLPGIGDALARRIVACRPYLTKTDLVTKKVMPAGPYMTLKNRVVALQKGLPKADAGSAACA